MKNLLTFLVAFLGILSNVTGQAAQFAVVRPNGTTFICPSLDSAYNFAINGDFLYLPGGSYTFSSPILKSIHIYGAGIHPDSSAATTRTILGVVTIGTEAENGSITGCYMDYFSVQNSPDNYTIFNCYIAWGLGEINSNANSFLITNNVIGSQGSCYYSPGGWAMKLLGANHLISNNLIKGRVLSTGENAYRNNIFTYVECGSFSCNNETFENNIFANIGSGASSCTFYNNIGLPNGVFGNNNQGYNNYQITDPIDSLFIDFQGGWDNGNLHLIPNSEYEDAGTNGTELGIYAGIFPTSEGWVPKNPHIYFKDIDEVTGSDGKLHIEVGVRTNN